MFIKKFIIRMFISNVSSQIKKMLKACKTGIIEKAIRYRKNWLRQKTDLTFWASVLNPVYAAYQYCTSSNKNYVSAKFF